MGGGRRLLVVLAAAVIGLVLPSSASAATRWTGSHVDVLVTRLEGGAGSTIGPDGALYVTENLAGRVTRVDPRTGDTSTFASGLPPAVLGLGGAMDVALIGRTAYALVTLVGPDVGGTSTVGIYRIDGPDSFTVIADIGSFSIATPPSTDFFVPSGFQYALETYRRDFLGVTASRPLLLCCSPTG